MTYFAFSLRPFARTSATSAVNLLSNLLTAENAEAPADDADFKTYHYKKCDGFVVPRPSWFNHYIIRRIRE